MRARTPGKENRGLVPDSRSGRGNWGGGEFQQAERGSCVAVNIQRAANPDEIMEKRDSLIESLERRLAQHTAIDALFTIRWVVA